MKHISGGWLAVLLFLAAPGVGAQESVLQALENERKGLFAMVADSVVFVRCGEESFGSGFFVDPSGLIATNRHVVECGGGLTVFTRAGDKLRAHVAQKDPLYDLALIAIRTDGVTIKPLVLADSDLTQVGDYAAAVSHPVGGVWTLNEGIISNRYPARQDQYAGVLQTQVPLQPGSSGGPMFNRKGQVVGVVTAKLKSGDNTGFCIQSNLVRRLLMDHAAQSGGQLAVNGALPGAEVWVDGAMHGRVPVLLTLSPGGHQLVVRHGGQEHQQDVVLQKGKVTQVFVKKEDLR